MSSKRFSMVSKKIDADISQFMKLAKSKLGTRTESDAMRLILRGKAGNLNLADLLEDAQQIATMHGYEVDVEEVPE